MTGEQLPSYLLHYVRTRHGLAVREITDDLRLRVAALRGNYNQVSLPSALAVLQEVRELAELLRELERLAVETCMDDKDGSWLAVAERGYGESRHFAYTRYRRSGGLRTWKGGRRRKYSGFCACGHVDDDHAGQRRGACSAVDEGAACLCDKYVPRELDEEEEGV